MTPKRILLSDLSKHLDDQYDLFICSSSFEERSLSITKNINTKIFRRSLILSNQDLQPYVGKNKAELLKIYGTASEIVEVCTGDPLITADSIMSHVSSVVKEGFASSILLDITTFTHESLLILLRLLEIYCNASKITCAYANASEYSVGDDVKQKWLSRGIGEVRSVLGYPGKIVPSRETHLILIVGYEHERAGGLIAAIEPHSISLGFGRSGSATTDKDQDANERYMHLVEQVATSFSEINKFEIPCNDPYGTKDELLKQIDLVKDKNVVIAPMNNKLSTVGTAMAAIESPDVQLCYPPALRYNFDNYSSPGSHCYLFNLELSKK